MSDPTPKRPARGETVLVVDDDAAVRASLALMLKHAGYRTLAAASPAEASKALAGAPAPDLVLLDMNFGRATTGDEGLRVLAEVKGRRPTLPVILMTAWGSIGLAVEGMRRGAADFVTKPWANAQILASVQTALGLAATEPLSDARAPLAREEVDARYDFSAVVGKDPALVRALEVAGRVSRTDASILVTGESGTGKELVAEAVHRNSRRRAGPFVKVNLGAVPSALFESEMFGHVRGAFTDARQARRGRFETADGGTIFLDEIGDLDASAQVKLLRVLQDRSFEVLGSSVTRTVDVRVVSATNRDLGEMVASGAFREDLLYRLNLIVVRLPSLRERRDDIPALAAEFLARAAAIYDRPRLTIAPEAARWLQGLDWPGNIRQLRNVVERAVLVGAGEQLTVDDFVLDAGDAGGEAAPDPSGAGLPDVGAMTIDEIERAMIVKSMRHHAGNVSRVAESLGLSRPALYRRLEKYGIKS